MKKLVSTVLAVMLIICIFSGCPSENAFVPPSQSLLVFAPEEEQVGTYMLNVDLNAQKIELDLEPVYVVPATPSMTEDRIFPQYISKSTLILRDNPISFSKYNEVHVSLDDNRLYFEEYIMEVNGEKNAFKLMQGDKTIASDIGLTHNDELIMPCSFFVDNEGNIAVLGMTNELLSETDMVTLLYKSEGETYIADNFHVYDDIWETYDLSKTDCPNYHSHYANVIASADNNSFLYNETAK